jgi:hypothetical protein
MSSDVNHPSVIDPLVEDLTSLSSGFEESFERLPTAREFILMLAEGIKWSKDEFLSDANGVNLEKLSARFLGPSPISAGLKEISTDELTDSVLALSCRTISVASRHIQALTGGAPTLAELCRVLGEALGKCRSGLLADIPPQSIQDITGKMKKAGKVAAKPGDIVAIPSPETGLFYFACVAAKNRFGTAFGFFKGVFPPMTPSQMHRLPALQNVIYSGEQCLASGRWTIVGHDDNLLRRFPSDPELFYRTAPNAPFGLGETSAGKIRQLSKEEANRIGLLDNSYRQLYTCDFLEKRLPALLEKVS